MSGFERFDVLASPEGVENEAISIDGISLDTALLIAAATAKGINPALWLTEQIDAGVRPFSDFYTKLVSLGLAVGIQEDRDTKRELDQSTSKANLRTIYHLCRAGKDQNGVILVDVALFLRLCNLKILEYVGLVKSEVQPVSQIPSTPKDSQAPLVLTASPPPKDERQPSRPQVVDQVSDSTEHVEVATRSRYMDEEVIAEPELSSSKEVAHAADERPGSAATTGHPPRVINKSSSPQVTLRATPVRSQRTASLPSRGPGSVDRSAYLQGLCAENPTTAILREVETCIQSTVRHSDLFHILQVHLGFLSGLHAYDPPRGKRVVSVPRRLLSWNEVQNAFQACRLRLHDFQMVALYKLLDLFAEHRPLTETKERVDDDEFEITDQSIRHFKKQLIESARLQEYLVNLRLQRRGREDAVSRSPTPWEAWAAAKEAKKLKVVCSKPAEFEKALAGLPYELTDAEVLEHLKTYSIIPEELLETLLVTRVREWALDLDARRDYAHKYTVELDRWMKEHGQSKRDAKGVAEGVKAAIKDKLFARKKGDLLESETTDAALSTELFRKFDAQCAKEGRSGQTQWKQWLERHLEVERQGLDKAQASRRSQKTALAVESKRSRAVAVLSVLEAQLIDAARSLTSHQHLELRKGLVRLRRLAKEKGADAIISRKEFNCLFEGLSTVLNEKGVFCENEEDAVQCAVEARAAVERRRNEEFTQWRLKKEDDDKAKAYQKEQEKQHISIMKKGKLSAARKSYKTWKRLLLKEKYDSKEEGVTRRPLQTIVKHLNAWNDDADMKRYHTYVDEQEG